MKTRIHRLYGCAVCVCVCVYIKKRRTSGTRTLKQNMVDQTEEIY